MTAYTRLPPQAQIDFGAAETAAERAYREQRERDQREATREAGERRYAELSRDLLDVSDAFVAGGDADGAKLAVERTITEEMDRLRPDLVGRHLWLAKGRKA